MLEVSEEIKNLYRNGTNSKSLILEFPELDLTITNEKIYYESMEITESISEEDELIFGDCNAAEIKIIVADIVDDLNEQTFTISQVLNGDTRYSMPLGTYKVKSCKRQSDRRFKEIIAYDDMLKLDRDVIPWYNSRQFPVTLKDLRESLLIYCGIAYESQDLTNDSILINKTIRPSSMNGRDVMKRICELNGGFGHITRQNKFKVVTLAGLGLYPSETLYPSEDLFPAEAGEVIDGSSSGASYYPESTYEDYICRAIDQLKIRTNEEDGGVIVNNGKTGTNEYIIQGNFLISDKSKEELTDIAEALFLVIKNKYYRPHNMIVAGLPYLEVGDSILIATRDDVIESFIFSRTLTGIQALKDTLGATGYEYRQNKVGLDIQISQLELVQNDLQDKAEELKETTNELEETAEEMGQEIEEIQKFNGETIVNLQKLDDSIVAEVKRATSAEEGLSSRVGITEDNISAEVTRATKAEGELSSKINVTAEQITSEVTRAKSAESNLSSRIIQTADQLTAEVKRASSAENNLSARIDVTATQISSKVSKGDVCSEINQSAEQITLRGNRLVVESTNFQLDANGNAVFSGTVSGAIVIAKETLYLCDQLHQEDKAAIGANDNALYFGASFPDGAYFLYGLHVTDDLGVCGDIECSNTTVNSRMKAGIVEATLITCGAINADSHFHNYRTSDIYWEDNGNSNVCFAGTSLRGASTSWVLANFERASCDERMKEDITALDEKVISAYMDFLPVQYRYKEKTNYNKKLNFGVTAQNIMKSFEKYGLDWNLYDIIEEKSVYDIDLCGDILEYTNGEDYYVVNDKNLHALHISMIQQQQSMIEKQQKEINDLKSELTELKDLLRKKGVL